jgi:hypothetical protein
MFHPLRFGAISSDSHELEVADWRPPKRIAEVKSELSGRHFQRVAMWRSGDLRKSQAISPPTGQVVTEKSGHLAI